MKQTRDPRTLRAAAVVDRLPMLSEDDPQFRALLASIEADGVRDPITLDQHGEIVDGRNRVKCAVLANRDEVPIEQKTFASEADALEFACSRLFARRHYTDSARAYIVAGLNWDRLEAGKARKKANLKNAQIPHNSSMGENSPIEGAKGRAAESLAALHGFSKDRFKQAVAVLKLFAAHPECKAEYETAILSGEKSLWNVLSAIEGRFAVNNKGRVDGRVRMDEALFKWIEVGVHRFTRYWPKLTTQAVRLRIADKLAEELLEALPAEVLSRIAKKIRAAGRGSRDERAHLRGVRRRHR